MYALDYIAINIIWVHVHWWPNMVLSSLPMRHHRAAFSTLLAATYMSIINLCRVIFFRCWNRIRSGGLTSDTMVSCGIWTTIVQTWSRLSVVWKAYWSTHSSREHTSLHGRVCSGRKPQVLKSLWNTRSWLMHRDLVWIRSPTVDSHSGGRQPSTEPM